MKCSCEKFDTTKQQWQPTPIRALKMGKHKRIAMDRGVIVVVEGIKIRRIDWEARQRVYNSKND